MFIFILNFIFGLILVVIGFFLRLLDSTRDLSMNFLEFVFRIVPFFSVNFGILNLSNLSLYHIVFEWDETPKPFDSKGCLWDFLMLIIMGIVYIGLIIFFENAFKIAKSFKTFNIEKI